jgi:hypothetical protein
VSACLCLSTASAFRLTTRLTTSQNYVTSISAEVFCGSIRALKDAALVSDSQDTSPYAGVLRGSGRSSLTFQRSGQTQKHQSPAAHDPPKAAGLSHQLRRGPTRSRPFCYYSLRVGTSEARDCPALFPAPVLRVSVLLLQSHVRAGPGFLYYPLLDGPARFAFEPRSSTPRTGPR